MYTYFNTSNFGENYTRNYANSIEHLLRKTNSLFKTHTKTFWYTYSKVYLQCIIGCNDLLNNIRGTWASPDVFLGGGAKFFFI